MANQWKNSNCCQRFSLSCFWEEEEKRKIQINKCSNAVLPSFLAVHLNFLFFVTPQCRWLLCCLDVQGVGVVVVFFFFVNNYCCLCLDNLQQNLGVCGWVLVWVCGKLLKTILRNIFKIAASTTENENNCQKHLSCWRRHHAVMRQRDWEGKIQKNGPPTDCMQGNIRKQHYYGARQ